jgi:hypothetical protein
MASRKKVRVEALDNLPESVDALPPYRPVEVTPREAVRRALPQIRAMQQKGYTLVAIADFLSARGLEVTALSLKRYMSLVGPGGARTAKRHRQERASATTNAAKSRATNEAGPVNEAAAPATEAMTTPGVSNPTAPASLRKMPPKDAARAPSVRSTSTQGTVTTAPTPATPARRSAFVVREDSDEI